VIGYISGVIGIVISIIMIVLFIFGLWLSKRLSFNGGFYFFLLLIVHEIYSFVSPILIRNYIDHLVIENKYPIMGMTLGELVVLFSLIPKIIVMIAFICLIYGLRKFFINKSPNNL
jgi:hypothetical protein